MDQTPFAQAVEASGLSKEELAEKVEVHPGTVYAWLGPRPRRVNPVNRQKLAKLLGQTTEELWPPEPDEPDDPSGVTDFYTRQSEVPPEVWDSMITTAESRVMIHAGAGVVARETNSDMGPVWVGRDGLEVQILLVDGESAAAEALALSGFKGKTEGFANRIDIAIDEWLDRLEGVGNWEIRVSQLPLYTSLYIFDNRGVVTVHNPGVRGHNAPTFTLTSVVGGGWLDHLAAGFSFAWDHPTTTVKHSPTKEA